MPPAKRAHEGDGTELVLAHAALKVVKRTKLDNLDRTKTERALSLTKPLRAKPMEELLELFSSAIKYYYIERRFTQKDAFLAMELTFALGGSSHQYRGYIERYCSKVNLTKQEWLKIYPDICDLKARGLAPAVRIDGGHVIDPPIVTKRMRKAMTISDERKLAPDVSSLRSLNLNSMSRSHHIGPVQLDVFVPNNDPDRKKIPEVILNRLPIQETVVPLQEYCVRAFQNERGGTFDTQISSVMNSGYFLFLRRLIYRISNDFCDPREIETLLRTVVNSGYRSALKDMLTIKSTAITIVCEALLPQIMFRGDLELFAHVVASQPSLQLDWYDILKIAIKYRGSSNKRREYNQKAAVSACFHRILELGVCAKNSMEAAILLAAALTAGRLDSISLLKLFDYRRFANQVFSSFCMGYDVSPILYNSCECNATHMIGTKSRRLRCKKLKPVTDSEFETKIFFFESLGFQRSICWAYLVAHGQGNLSAVQLDTLWRSAARTVDNSCFLIYNSTPQSSINPPRDIFNSIFKAAMEGFVETDIARLCYRSASGQWSPVFESEKQMKEICFCKDLLASSYDWDMAESRRHLLEYFARTFSDHYYNMILTLAFVSGLGYNSVALKRKGYCNCRPVAVYAQAHETVSDEEIDRRHIVKWRGLLGRGVKPEYDGTNPLATDKFSVVKRGILSRNKDFVRGLLEAYPELLGTEIRSYLESAIREANPSIFLDILQLARSEITTLCIAQNRSSEVMPLPRLASEFLTAVKEYDLPRIKDLWQSRFERVKCTNRAAEVGAEEAALMKELKKQLRDLMFSVRSTARARSSARVEEALRSIFLLPDPQMLSYFECKCKKLQVGEKCEPLNILQMLSEVGRKDWLESALKVHPLLIQDQLLQRYEYKVGPMPPERHTLQSPLHYAVEHGNASFVEFIIQQTLIAAGKRKIPSSDTSLQQLLFLAVPAYYPGDTLLNFAIRLGNLAVVRCLLEYGAKPDRSSVADGIHNKRLDILALLFAFDFGLHKDALEYMETESGQTKRTALGQFILNFGKLETCELLPTDSVLSIAGGSGVLGVTE